MSFVLLCAFYSAEILQGQTFATAAAEPAAPIEMLQHKPYFHPIVGKARTRQVIPDEFMYITFSPDTGNFTFQILKDGTDKNTIMFIGHIPGEYRVSIVVPECQVVTPVLTIDEENTIPTPQENAVAECFAKLVVEEILVKVIPPDYVPPTPPNPIPPDPTPIPPEPKPDPDDPYAEFAEEVKEVYDALPDSVKYMDVEIVQGDGHRTKKKANAIVSDCYMEAAGCVSNSDCTQAKMINLAKACMMEKLSADALTAWKPFLSGVATPLNNLQIPEGDCKILSEAFIVIAEVVAEQNNSIASVTKNMLFFVQTTRRSNRYIFTPTRQFESFYPTAENLAENSTTNACSGST